MPGHGIFSEQVNAAGFPISAGMRDRLGARNIERDAVDEISADLAPARMDEAHGQTALRPLGLESYMRASRDARMNTCIHASMHPCKFFERRASASSDPIVHEAPSHA